MATQQVTIAELKQAESLLNQASISISRAGHPVHKEDHLAQAQTLALLAIGKILLAVHAPEN